MNPGVARRTVIGLSALALLCLLGGLATGLYGGAPAPASVTAPDPQAEAGSEARDAALALRALDAHGHWGRYVAAAEGTPRPQESRPQTGLAADAIARNYSLVGIERRDGEARALLLPAGAAPDSAEVLRLGTGDSLAEGIRVSAIGRDSVRFDTATGSSTLTLYGSEP